MKRQVVLPVAPGAASVPTILDVKQARQRSARLVSAWRNRFVCRFWTEKLLVVVDALQLYALLWQLSQPWPWPARWLASMRWTNAFNADVFSFGARGAAMGATSQPFSLWGEMQYYWVYALSFSTVPYLLWGVFRAMTRRWEAQGRDDFLTRQSAWANALVHVLYFLYVPVGLAVLRLVNCDSDGRVSVDPETFPTCGAPLHLLAVIVITCSLGGGFLVGFPLWLRHTIRSTVFTDDPDEHERFLQSTELAYVLEVSDEYTDQFVPAFASVRVHAVDTMAHACGLKLALLVVFSCLRSRPPSISNQGLQCSLFFAVLVIMAWRLTWSPIFRVDSTNQLAKRLAWQLVANGVIALLCANGVRSAVTVSTSVTASLSFLNLVFLSTVALSVGQCLRQWLHRQDLEPAVGGTLQSVHACWPTHPLMTEITSDKVPLDNWIQVVHDARALSLQVATAASTMQPLEELAAVARRLDVSWQEATAMDHPLASYLRQELLLLMDLFVDAVATSPFRDAEQQKRHESDFIALVERLRRRDDNERLVPSTQRRVLSKLRIASTWAVVQEDWPKEKKDQQI